MKQPFSPISVFLIINNYYKNKTKKPESGLSFGEWSKKIASGQCVPKNPKPLKPLALVSRHPPLSTATIELYFPTQPLPLSSSFAKTLILCLGFLSPKHERRRRRTAQQRTLRASQHLSRRLGWRNQKSVSSIRPSLSSWQIPTSSGTAFPYPLSNVLSFFFFFFVSWLMFTSWMRLIAMDSVVIEYWVLRWFCFSCIFTIDWKCISDGSAGFAI